MEPCIQPFAVKSDAAGRRMLEALSARFPVRREPRRVERVVYLDTFDWRLYRKERVLNVSRNGKLHSLRLETADGSVLHHIEVGAVPAFSRDVPPGAVRDEIAALAGIRRLLPRVEVERGVHAIRILDAEEKTVARVLLEATTRPAAAPVVLRVLPVRGFPEHHREVVLFMEQQLGLVHQDGSPLEMLLAATGRRANDYSSKIDLHFDAAEPAGHAVRTILRALVVTMEANREGLRRDLDPEFLHDFRVACRRTRSCLRQLREALPPADVERFNREFKWVGGVTGPMRDLDVYVLKLDDYRSDIPDQRDDLRPIEELLRKRRARERKRLVRAIDSSRFAGLFEAWRAFIDREHGTDRERPIGEVAPARIARLHRRVLERGDKLGPQSPSDKFHRLRIECKKLRYLLEFFRSLYEPGAVADWIKDLKRLQDNLGDMNDLRVHRSALAGFAEELLEARAAPAETLLAMGRLVERLWIRQDGAREAFAEIFGAFARKGAPSLTAGST